MSKLAKIGLGTVQFGLPYGPHAQKPVMEEAEVQSILAAAIKSGIHFYDTSPVYGEAEKRVGNSGLTKKFDTIEVSSKVPSVAKDVYHNKEAYQEFVFSQVRSSLRNLNLSHFKLLQFHQSNLDFLSTPHLADVMQSLLDSGVCESIGVSVYFPEEAAAALKLAPVSALQIPVNLLDRRFLSPQLKELYADKQTRLIARSVFLQGVLFEEGTLPRVKKTALLREYQTKAKEIARSFSLPIETLALGFVFSELREIETGLLGVDSHKSLEENLTQIRRARADQASGMTEAFHTLAAKAVESGVLSPQLWDVE